MTTINSIPDLCELSIHFSYDEASTADLVCIVDLRLANGEIPLGDEECQVTFERVIVSVDVEGMKILPGTRFGEPNKSNTVAKTNKTVLKGTKQKSRGMKLTAGLKSKPEATFNAGIGCTEDKQKEQTSQEEVPHYRVKARPNDRWEVTEPDREPLDGTYMESTPLFKAQVKEHANRVAANIELKIKQRDLVINQIYRNESAVSFFNSISKNQRRLIDIFIAKSLSNAIYGNRKYVGELVLSEFQFEERTSDES